MAAEQETREIPWNLLPIAEAMHPGENSISFLRERGWPVWTAALIARVEHITTAEAEVLIEAGELSINGETVKGFIEYLPEGALVTIQGRPYRIGSPGPDHYGGR